MGVGESMRIKTQTGVGLIELLVTLLILSTSLLALTALQTRSLQFNQGAYFRSQANILAYDILDRLRANQRHYLDYNVAASAFVDGGAVTTPIAAADIYKWRKIIDARLPGGKGAVACDANTVCTITIVWNELNGSGKTEEDTSTFEFMAKLR